MSSEARIDSVLQTLRFALGGTAFVAGFDKFTNLLTDWDRYLSRPVRRNLPLQPRNFMRLVGVVEMAVGAMILGGETRVGGYLAGAWLMGISANLVSSGKYLDVAARDVNMAMAAYALARLTEVRRVARQARPFEAPRAA